MSNNKQSSLEWFAEMVSKMGYVSAEILEQAKAMHKDEIINAWDRGQYIGENFPQRVIPNEYEQDEEQYYNEMFE